MRGPRVRLQLPDGQIVDVAPGGIIGRLVSAAVRLNDPRISEIHALVSLRGRVLKLLAQRVMLRLGGRAVSEVTLQDGQHIELVKGITLKVLEVVLPAQVPMIEGEGLRPVELSAPIYSLRLRPRALLLPSHLPGAPMHLWSTEEGWYLEIAPDPPRLVSVGDSWTVGEVSMTMVAVPLCAVSTDNTRSTGRITPPIHIVARYETVHVQIQGQPQVVISGIPAKIISELVSFGVPVSWELLAKPLWPNATGQTHLRQNWDRTMRRLRARLRDLGLPTNLVQADGRGNVELVVRQIDQVVDQT